MTWLALFLPLTMQGPRDATPTQWAPTAAVARVEAQYRQRPILAAVTTDPFRGARLVDMLSSPTVPSGIQDFILVRVTNPEDYRSLDPKSDAPPFSQCVFFTPGGKRIKRTSGLLFDADLQRCFASVQWAMPYVSGKVPRGRWTTSETALISAMMGQTAEAERLLPKIPASERVKVWQALAEEYRASGRLQAAVMPLKKAISAGPQGRARSMMQATLGFLYMRLSQNTEATQQLRQALTSSQLSPAERETLERTLERMDHPFSAFGR